MDIHRCRFVPYPASAINAIAFSHPHISTSNKHNKKLRARLAIGRANGDIEIWNPHDGAWLQETIIHGGEGRSIDGLAWINGEDEVLEDGKPLFGDSRLFSIGYTTTVTEWDLENARAKRHASGQHGDIWCFGAQPRAPPGTPGSKSQLLVAGTMDGSLVLFNTEDDDLRYRKVYKTRAKHAKIVSIAFQSRNIAVAGCSDGTIRVFDVRNGSMPKTMTVGRDLAGGSKDVIVWSVKCLPNGDIVSGDSTGQICIWDGKTYTQAQRIQGHTQDVLSLATSADGKAIVSGGMDTKTVLYREMPGRAHRWAKVYHRRFHSHDVKAIAAFETKDMSVVVTGGPDATPVVMPLQKSGSENHRTLSHLPQTVPISSARKARLIVGWWDREMHIWQLQKPIAEILSGVASESQIDRNRRLLGRISIKGDSNITAGAISEDGGLVVVSTALEVKAFQLRLEGSAGDDRLRISKLALPSHVANHGATSVGVSPDGRWVCLTQGRKSITVLDMKHQETAGGGRPTTAPKAYRLNRIRRDIPKHTLLGNFGRYNRQVTHVAFSPDGRVLATADLSGYIDTWVLRGDTATQGAATNQEAGDDAALSSDDDSEDDSGDEGDPTRAGCPWIRNPQAKLLPKIHKSVVALSLGKDVISPPPKDGTNAQAYVLVAVTTDNEIFAFNPLKGKLVPWHSRLRPLALPVEFQNIRDHAKGIIWQGPRLWIYGPSFLFMVDGSVEVPKLFLELAAAEQQNLKRKRGDESGAGNKMAEGALEPRHVRMAVKDGEDNKWVDIEMADKREDGSDDDEDDYWDGGELLSRRLVQDAITKSDSEEPQQRRYWLTFKFRPILGVLPLSAADVVGPAGQYPPLEVAVVERPTWDLNLPARYLENEEVQR